MIILLMKIEIDGGEIKIEQELRHGGRWEVVGRPRLIINKAIAPSTSKAMVNLIDDGEVNELGNRPPLVTRNDLVYPGI